jgi:hypothetical protein
MLVCSWPKVVRTTRGSGLLRDLLQSLCSGIRLEVHDVYQSVLDKGQGKAVPLQARSGPEGSRKLSFPDVMTTAQDGGKVVSLTHRPSLPSGNTPATHFC